MILTSTLLKKIANAADGTVYEGYSGRGMFGQKCFGIVSANPIRVIEAAAALGLCGARMDDLGRETIVYWPTAK